MRMHACVCMHAYLCMHDLLDKAVSRWECMLVEGTCRISTVLDRHVCMWEKAVSIGSRALNPHAHLHAPRPTALHILHTHVTKRV